MFGMKRREFAFFPIPVLQTKQLQSHKIRGGSQSFCEMTLLASSHACKKPTLAKGELVSEVIDIVQLKMFLGTSVNLNVSMTTVVPMYITTPSNIAIYIMAALGLGT